VTDTTDLELRKLRFLRAAERSTTLYALSEQYIQLVELLEDPEAETEAIEAALDEVSGAIAQKAEAIAGLIRWYEGLADLRRAEAKRMADSVASFQRQVDRLRSYVLRHMQAAGMERVDTSRFTLSVRQNPPRVEVLEELLVPSEFQRQKLIIDVDKRKILEHTRLTGEIVPGTEIVRGERLDIR
jgi:Siphovirus Gp157